jgi:selenocysteine-specific elongation factor
VVCSAVTGEGVADVAAALDQVAAQVPSRAGRDGARTVLHVDRSFTVHGIGAVVTGTLWSGALRAGDALAVLPGDRRPVRVRGLQVHDQPVDVAAAGQRVAVNLAGVRARDVARGDVLAAPGALRPTLVLDCALALAAGARHGERVQVHHGTRDVAGRLADLGDGLWQLRLERPVLAADGDHVVVRRLSPPDTLGGGVVLDAAARKHGRRSDLLARLAALRDGRPVEEKDGAVGGGTAARGRGAAGGGAAALDPSALARVEARLRDAGASLLSEAQLADDVDALRALRAAGRAVRVSGTLYAHADVVDELRAKIIALIEAHGSTSLAEVRDALGISRKPAQAFLEHLDAQRVTRRLPDDRRVLRAGARGVRSSAPAP